MNPLKVTKRYLLTTRKDDGSYEPMNDEEFEKFKMENPSIAKYFEVTENNEDVNSLSNLLVPEVPESSVIFDQWEKAAQRCLTHLWKMSKAYIF